MRPADGPPLHVDQQLYRPAQLQAVRSTLWLRLVCSLFHGDDHLNLRERGRSSHIKLGRILLLLQDVGPVSGKGHDGFLWLELLCSLFRSLLSRI